MGGILLIAAGAAGYIAGKYFFLSGQNDLEESSSITLNKDDNTPSPVHADGVFAAGHPHIGPLETLHSAPLSYSGDGTITAIFPLAVTSKMEPGTPLLFLNADGSVYPEAGVVHSLAFLNGDQVNARVTLLPPYSGRGERFHAAAFILSSLANARRLPLPALQKEERDGESSAFVWKIAPFTDRPGMGALVKLPVSSSDSGHYFFDVGADARTGDIFLLDPGNAALTEGQSVSFTLSDFDAPLFGLLEDAQVKAMNQRTQEEDQALEAASRDIPPMSCPVPWPSPPDALNGDTPILSLP